MDIVAELRAEILRDNERINADGLRIAELEDALRQVVRDVNDYEEVNKLSPNPGRTECWDSVAHAKAVLRKSR